MVISLGSFYRSGCRSGNGAKAPEKLIYFFPRSEDRGNSEDRAIQKTGSMYESARQFFNPMQQNFYERWGVGVLKSLFGTAFKFPF
jgi:hypothetical protein